MNRKSEHEKWRNQDQINKIQKPECFYGMKNQRDSTGIASNKQIKVNIVHSNYEPNICLIKFFHLVLDTSIIPSNYTWLTTVNLVEL